VKKGFTLVELLITASILMIVGLTIISAFAGGVKTYERVRAFEGARTDIVLLLEKMERDIRNIPKVSTIDFYGRRDCVSFAGIIPIIDSGGKRSVSLGRVLYYYDSPRKAVVREEQDYGRGLLDVRKGRGSIRKLASAEDVRFRYYCYDPEFEEYTWKDNWEPAEETEEEQVEESEILTGVKVKVSFNCRGKETALERTVFMPTTEKLLSQ